MTTKTTKTVTIRFPSRLAVRGLAITGIACAIACGVEPPAVSEAVAASGCQGPGCDDNSPIIAGVPFYELNRFGAPNDQGLRITDVLSPSGTAIRIDVRQGRPVGLDRLGNIVLDGPAMVGSIIKLADAQGRTWDIQLSDASSIPFWAEPAGLATLFELRVRGPMVLPPGVDSAPLCPMTPEPSEWPGGNVLHAIFFEGDRYDHIAKSVWATGAETAGWFNIACAGSATAKMFLTRHAEASTDLPTTRAERNALLKAYTATMCPGSMSFTGVGERLHVATSNEILPVDDSYSNVEGLWNEDGIVCTGEHRLVHANSMDQQAADALMAKIEPQCGALPPCTTADIDDWQVNGLVLTHNP